MKNMRFFENRRRIGESLDSGEKPTQMLTVVRYGAEADVTGLAVFGVSCLFAFTGILKRR